MQVQMKDGVPIPWLLLGLLVLPLVHANGNHHHGGHRRHRHHNHHNTVDNNVDNSVDTNVISDHSSDHIPGYRPRNHHQRCDLAGTPHHRGICGARLAQLHSNICFLLRQLHPEYFFQSKSVWKRSADGLSGMSPRVALAAKSKRRKNEAASELASWNSHLEKELIGQALKYNPSISSIDNLADVNLTSLNFQGSSTKSKNKVKADLYLHLGHHHSSRRSKRSVRRKRSIVCECCMNPCMTADIARYC